MIKELLDKLTGRSPQRDVADRMNQRFDEKKIDAAMNAVMYTKDALVDSVSGFSDALELLAKDLGYVDKRNGKGKPHAKAHSRSPKA